MFKKKEIIAVHFPEELENRNRIFLDELSFQREIFQKPHVAERFKYKADSEKSLNEAKDKANDWLMKQDGL